MDTKDKRGPGGPRQPDSRSNPGPVDRGAELPPEITKLGDDSRIAELLDNLMPASDQDMPDDAVEFRKAVIALKEATRKREERPAEVKYATEEDRREGRTTEMAQAIGRIAEIINRQETGSDVPADEADKVRQGAVDFMAYTASAQAVYDFQQETAQARAQHAARHQAKPPGVTHDPGHHRSAAPHAPLRQPAARTPGTGGQADQDFPQNPPPVRPRNR